MTVTTTGGGFIVSNGLLTLTLNGSGLVTQVTKNGQSLMGPTDTLYVSESGGAAYYGPANGDRSPLATGAPSGPTVNTVVRQTADLVELSFLDTTGGSHDMDWDVHYIVRRGVSGYYYFLVTRSGTTTHPAAPTLSELRTVQHFDAKVLSNGYSGERHGALPTDAQFATFSATTAVQDNVWPLTVPPTKLPGVSSLPGVVGQDYDEGPLYGKYDWAAYRTEDLVHGLYGNGFGAWLISPSSEFYTGGPVKQELMVHQHNLILNMYHGAHFGSLVTTPAPANWQKIYGPNLVYVDTGTDAAVIADALAQGATERSQWPYCWMAHDLYPSSAQRGTVAGTIAEAHGQSVAGAMVVLAGPGPLISQGYGYMFWSQADAMGSFSIPEVRPGSYSIHVYATKGTIIDDPAHGEIVGTVNVVAGTNNLGQLTWSPPFHAHMLWAIGTSDQRSGEFRFSPTVAAGPDNVAAVTGRMYGPDPTHGVWTVPPATTRYAIGSSSPQTDWYFAQSADGVWTVDFSLATVPSGGAFLTIGVAGAARTPTLTVAMNGTQLLQQVFGNDQSLYRSALQGGQFQMLTATVPPAALKAGANSVTFQLSTKGLGGAGIFYDVVKLESD
ncbi:MAG: polysaccharide lyase family protein [Myxococcota bacterium]|nr:polysaccharide lyase family protein [Myxococcota bacterium]